MKVTNDSMSNAGAIVAWHVLHPGHHEQESVISKDGYESLDEIDFKSLKDGNICGTTMCIAGTAVYLAEGAKALKRAMKNDTWVADGAEALGLDVHEAYKLFHVMDNEVAMRATAAIAVGDEKEFKKIMGNTASSY
jgi:hypothetical protein